MILKFKSITNELLKGWKLALYHYFTRHSMCIKVKRVTEKTRCTSCTKWTISFEVSGFQTKTHLLQKDFIFFWTYLNCIVFLCSKCTIQSHIINFQPFPTSFVIFHAFTLFWAIRPWNWKAFEMNSEKVEVWHGIIISPT